MLCGSHGYRALTEQLLHSYRPSVPRGSRLLNQVIQLLSLFFCVLESDS